MIIPRLRVTIGMRRIGVSSLILLASIGSVRLSANTGTCGGRSINIPFTDVASSNIFFCSIAAAYFSGLTNGTTATTYTPGQSVPREQMAAFVSRTLDQSLKRGSRRAALNQWWMPAQFPNYARIPVGAFPGAFPTSVAFDGADLWVASFNFKTVTRLRASDGRVLQVWTVGVQPYGVLVAQGKVYVTGFTTPGRLYGINPATGGGGGTATLITNQLTNLLGALPRGLAFDGRAIWTADEGGSVSRYSNGITVVIPGFTEPRGILYDGNNIWVSDYGSDTLKRLNSDGFTTASVPVGSGPGFPAFDGTNVWVPCAFGNSVSIVRVKDSAGNPLGTPFVLATLTGNGLGGALSAAFDGQRVLVTNLDGNKLSLWKASDLSPLGFVSTGTGIPGYACSDGINFWITLDRADQLLRF